MKPGSDGLLWGAFRETRVVCFINPDCQRNVMRLGVLYHGRGVPTNKSPARCPASSGLAVPGWTSSRPKARFECVLPYHRDLLLHGDRSRGLRAVQALRELSANRLLHQGRRSPEWSASTKCVEPGPSTIPLKYDARTTTDSVGA